MLRMHDFSLITTEEIPHHLKYIKINQNRESNFTSLKLKLCHDTISLTNLKYFHACTTSSQ